MSNILARVYDAALLATTSDTVDDPQGPFAGLLAATAGTVSFIDMQGNTVTTGSVLAGTELHIAAKRVKTTGTSATVYGLRAGFYFPKASGP